MKDNKMIYTYNTLYQEVINYWSEIAKETPKRSFKLKPPKREIQRGFKAYESGYNALLPLIILGAPHIREDYTLLKNFGTLATDSQANQKEITKFFKEINPSLEDKKIKELVKKHLQYGSIMNDSNWWIFRNDMFILGGIHGEKEFHLALSKTPSVDLLWDKENQRLSTLGRELIMINLAEYKCIKTSSKLGIIFAPSDDKRKPTLRECRDEIASIKSEKEIFEKNLRP